MMSVSTKINQLISLREKIAKDLGFYVDFDLANSSWSYSKKAGQIKRCKMDYIVSKQVIEESIFCIIMKGGILICSGNVFIYS